MIVLGAALAPTLLFALVSDDEAEALARSVLGRMTLEEKTMMTGGSGTMTLAALPRIGISREWTFADSSSTVRAKMSRWDWSYCGTNDEATVLASLSGLASTWNVDLARRHGEVLGEEARDKGVDQLLGPGLNLMRTPLCGRNWEYFGEDPLLAARLCVPLIRGIQSRDVAATAKHFILNDQELARDGVDTHCDARTLNEIYLMPFRAAIEEAGLLSVMTSYNRIDGIWASEHPVLLKDVLRGRLGFKGLVTTDWGGQHSTAVAANNGGGLEMHWGQGIKYNYQAISNRFPLAEAVRRGEVAEAVVDDMAFRTLFVMAKTGFLGGKRRFVGSRNTREHQEFARKEAGEAIVLLKNGGKLLPLKTSQIRRLAVVGLRADEKQCNKGCSTEGKPPYEITPFAGLKERFAAAEVTLHPLPIAADAVAKEVATDISDAVRAGAHADMERGGLVDVDEVRLRQALESSDAVVVFTGTELGWGAGRESEGGDRPTMKGRPGEDAAVRKVLDWVGEKTVVVVRCGSPVEYTWWDKAKSVLNMSYLGQEAGHALGDVVSGDVNPSGKLPYSWPKRYSDTAIARCGDYNPTNVTYRERFYVGYRWFDVQGLEPQFPFGHGLSYTTFKLGGLRTRVAGNGDILVSIDVANSGTVFGKETVQAYVAYLDSKVKRCRKELKGFAKVGLKPGETRAAEIKIRRRDLGYWDEGKGGFTIEDGRYVILVGTSSFEPVLRSELMISTQNH